MKGVKGKKNDSSIPFFIRSVNAFQISRPRLGFEFVLYCYDLAIRRNV